MTVKKILKIVAITILFIQQTLFIILFIDWITMNKPSAVQLKVQDNYNYYMGTCYLQVNEEGFILKALPYKHYSEEYIKGVR